MFRAPLFLIGFPLPMIVFVHGVNLVYQFWIHTEAIDRFPRWFEAVMNTPSHHRVHHAINARYLDANYAGVFIVWDRMFGTFVAETKDDPPRYGIVGNLASYNPLKVATPWLGLARGRSGQVHVRRAKPCFICLARRAGRPTAAATPATRSRRAGPHFALHNRPPNSGATRFRL